MALPLTQANVSAEITNSTDFVEITKVVKCDGDAYTNNRKGKVIIIYDLDIELEWKGKSCLWLHWD